MTDVIYFSDVTRGGAVLGICNGAQILSEAAVPGAFTTNAYPKFICKWVKLRVTGKSVFTTRSKPVIDIPIALKKVGMLLTKKRYGRCITTARLF